MTKGFAFVIFFVAMDGAQIPSESQVIRQRTSALAIASLVLSLIFCLFFIGPVLAIVFGLIALNQISRRPQELLGRGLALAGIIIGVLSLLLTFWMISACAKTYRRVDPTVENLLHSIDAGDYDAAMRDFDPRLAKVLPREDIASLGDMVHERLGRYETHHWGFTYQWNKIPGEPASLTIVYRCRFSKASENVYVRIVFREKNAHYRIVGLWFNTPELGDFKPKKHQDV